MCIILFVTFLWEVSCVGATTPRVLLLGVLGKPPSESLIVVIIHVQQLVRGHPRMLVVLPRTTTLEISGWIDLFCQ